MKPIFNPFTGNFDWVDVSDLSGYALLNHSIGQHTFDADLNLGVYNFLTSGTLGAGAITGTSLNTHTIPGGTGTIALTSDLASYVPINSGTTGQYASTEVTDTVDTGAVTVNWNDGNVHYMVLDAGANTITLTNPLSGGRYILNLKQPAAGEAGTVTFDPVPYWPDGVFITLTTTNNAIDVITFEYSAAIGKYIGSEMLDVK